MAGTRSPEGLPRWLAGVHLLCQQSLVELAHGQVGGGINTENALEYLEAGGKEGFGVSGHRGRCQPCDRDILCVP